MAYMNFDKEKWCKNIGAHCDPYEKGVKENKWCILLLLRSRGAVVSKNGTTLEILAKNVYNAFLR